MPAVKPIPGGYPRVSAHLTIDGTAGAIRFYREVLGTQERFLRTGPDGKVGHAELQIGDSVVILCDGYPDVGGVMPKALGGTPAVASTTTGA